MIGALPEHVPRMALQDTVTLLNQGSAAGFELWQIRGGTRLQVLDLPEPCVTRRFDVPASVMISQSHC